MRRTLVLVTLALCAGGLGTPALAQKSAPAVTRDADRDGVPDIRDRCRSTPAGTVVDATGCPAPPQQAAQPRPAGPAAPQPGAAGRPVVTQAQGARPDTAARTPPAAALGPPQPDTAAARRALAGARRPPAVEPQPAAGGNAPAQGAAGLPSPALPGVPQPAGAQPGAAQPAGAQPAGAQPAAAQPGAAGPAAQPAAQPTAEAEEVLLADVGAPLLSGGFFMPPTMARSETGRLEYLRIYAMRLDSAAVALVEVFRNTAAPPLNAPNPAALSSRVRDRFDACRRLYFDLVSFSDAMLLVQDSLTSNPLLRRAVAGLVDAFENTTALQQCDNIVGALEAPERWSPWQRYWEQSVRAFFEDWYTQLRAIHEANRSLARVLNGMLPAERAVGVLHPLPPNPPTIGSF